MKAQMLDKTNTFLSRKLKLQKYVWLDNIIMNKKLNYYK